MDIEEVIMSLTEPVKTLPSCQLSTETLTLKRKMVAVAFYSNKHHFSLIFLILFYVGNSGNNGLLISVTMSGRVSGLVESIEV